MRQSYYDSYVPFSGHIIFYSCNHFRHVEKEWRYISMNHQRQHGRQTYDIMRLKKYGSSNVLDIKHKEEDIRCGLSLCAFKNEDEW